LREEKGRPKPPLRQEIEGRWLILPRFADVERSCQMVQGLVGPCVVRYRLLIRFCVSLSVF
jgi:hypothetical protein